MAEGNQVRRSNYRTLMLAVFGDITKDDLEKLKFCLKKLNVRQGNLENAESGIDVLNLMEDCGILSEKKLQNLVDCLQDIGRLDLHRRVNTFMEQKYVYTGLKRKQTMFVVPFFQETSNSRILQNKMESSNVAVLSGPPASGKTQLAFWYAGKFSDINKNAVVWRFRCQDSNNLMTSMTDLLDDLGIELPDATQNKNESIYYMGELLRNYLHDGPGRNSCHLLVFDEVNPPCSNIVARIIGELKKDKNVKIIVTTNEKCFYQDFDRTSSIDIDGLSETECLEFFRQLPYFEGKESQIKELGQMVGYLPLALVIARSYITEAKFSIEKYIQCLNDAKFLQRVDKTFIERSEYKKGLVDSHIFVLTEIEASLEPEGKLLLKSLPFLDHDKVRVSILVKLLSSDIDDMKRLQIVVDFLNSLKQYSLISDLGGEDENRIVSFHAVTGLAMSNMFSAKDKAETIYTLLQFLCRNIDMDARLLTASRKNMKLLSHARRVLAIAQDMFFSDAQSNGYVDKKKVTILFCYVCCAVGVTYRVNGLEEYFADLYLNMARRYMLECVNIRSSDVSLDAYKSDVKENDPRHVLWRYLKSLMTKCPLDKMAANLHRKLTETGERMDDVFIRDFILSKERNSRDIDHICQLGNIQKSSFNDGTVTSTIYNELCKKGIAVPEAILKKYFLCELMLIILYNNGRNLCDMKYNLEGEQQENILEKGCFEFKLALALNDLLQSESRTFLPVQSLVLRRNGFHYLSVSDTPPNESTSKRREKFRNGIEQNVKLLKQDVLSKIYFEFGIPKISSGFDQHHKSMCFKHLLKCYLELLRVESDPSEREKLFESGIVYAQKLEGLTVHLSEWVALPGFHVQIAKFYSLDPKPENLNKAHEHFTKALTLEKEVNDDDMSHFSLQANFGLLGCYMDKGTITDLRNAEKLCRDLIDSLQSKNREQTLGKVRKILAKIQSKQTN